MVQKVGGVENFKKKESKVLLFSQALNFQTTLVYISTVKKLQHNTYYWLFGLKEHATGNTSLSKKYCQHGLDDVTPTLLYGDPGNFH